MRAASASEAVAACSDNTPDLVIIDGPMQEWMATSTRDVECDDARRPKIMLCASEHLYDQVWQALDMGADDYLMKPFDNDTLLIKLSALGVLKEAEVEQCRNLPSFA